MERLNSDIRKEESERQWHLHQDEEIAFGFLSQESGYFRLKYDVTLGYDQRRDHSCC